LLKTGHRVGCVESKQRLHVLFGQGAEVVEGVLFADLGHPTWVSNEFNTAGACRIPLHPLGTFFDLGRNLAQLPPQHAHLCHSGTNVLGQAGGNLAAHNVGQLRTVAVGADHDLQGPVTVHAAEVEVALWRHVCNVGGNLLLLAQLPDLGRGLGVVDGGQDHVDAIEIGRLELAVDVIDLLLLDAVGDLLVQAVARRHDGDFGVGVEDVHDAPGRDLLFGQPSILAGPSWRSTHLAAADNQDALIADLPCEDQRAAALYLGVGAFHGGCG
jgi:hypothetical protein